jgi:hypothetical protein
VSLVDQQRVRLIVRQQDVIVGTTMQAGLHAARRVGSGDDDHRDAAGRAVFGLCRFQQRQDVVAGLHYIDHQQIRGARDERSDRLSGQQETDDDCTVVFHDRFERLVLLLGAPDVRDTDLGQAITPVGALGKQAPRPR